MRRGECPLASLDVSPAALTGKVSGLSRRELRGAEAPLVLAGPAAAPAALGATRPNLRAGTVTGVTRRVAPAAAPPPPSPSPLATAATGASPSLTNARGAEPAASTQSR